MPERESMDRPEIVPPDEYVVAVRDQVLRDLLGRAGRELRHPLTAALALTKDREVLRDFGTPASTPPTKSRAAAQHGHARVFFNDSSVRGRLLFDLEARFAVDARTPGFAGFSVSGDVRDTGDGTLVAGFRHWAMHRGPAHWSGAFETDAERAHRLDVPAWWDVLPAGPVAEDLPALLGDLIRRYGLEGGYIAKPDGVMLLRAGELNAGENTGLAPILRADPAAVKECVERITIPNFPYSITQGRMVAYTLLPTATLFVMLLRERPLGAEQPDSWGFVSEATSLAEGRIAEQMLRDLRDGVRALGHDVGAAPGQPLAQ